MAMTQRTQYLYGKTVVDLANEQQLSAFEKPVVASVDPSQTGSHADLRQAEYYQELLEDLRTEINVELAHRYAVLAAREAQEGKSRAGRVQRIVQARETELAEIDRLTAAIQARFPTPQLGSEDPESVPRYAS